MIFLIRHVEQNNLKLFFKIILNAGRITVKLLDRNSGTGMTEQLGLFDDDDPFSHSLFETTSSKLIEKFRDYHEQNPDLYRLLERFALEAGKVRTRFSIWMIANRARWYSTVETQGSDYKISNDYLAMYSRLIVINNPHLEGMFQFKRMKPDRGVAK